MTHLNNHHVIFYFIPFRKFGKADDTMYKRNKISFADLFSSTNLNSSIEVSSQRGSSGRSLSQLQCSQSDLFENQRYEETPKKVPALVTEINMFETTPLNRIGTSMTKKQFSSKKTIEELDKKEELDILMRGLDALSIEVKDMVSSLGQIVKQPENIHQMISESWKEMEKKQDKILKGLEEKRSKNKAEKEILFEIKKLKDTVKAQEITLEKLGNSVAKVQVSTDQSLSQYAKELTELFKSFNQMNEKRNSSFCVDIRKAWDDVLKNFTATNKEKESQGTQMNNSCMLGNDDSDSDSTVFYHSNPALEYHGINAEHNAAVDASALKASLVPSTKNFSVFPQHHSPCPSKAADGLSSYNKAFPYGNFSLESVSDCNNLKNFHNNEKTIYKNEKNNFIRFHDCAPKTLITSDPYFNFHNISYNDYHSTSEQCNTFKEKTSFPPYFSQHKTISYKTNINNYSNFSIEKNETGALDLTMDELCSKFNNSLPLDLTFDSMPAISSQDADAMMKEDENKDALDVLVERHERLPLRHAPYNKPGKINIDVLNNSSKNLFYHNDEKNVDKIFKENNFDTCDQLLYEDVKFQCKYASVEFSTQNKENVDKFKLKTKKKVKKQKKRPNRSIVSSKRSIKNGKNMCILSQAYTFKDQRFEEEFNNEEISMYDSGKENIALTKKNDQPNSANELAETQLSSGLSNSSKSSAESVSQMFTILDII